MLGFVLVATIIGTQQSTRQTHSAHTVAIGVRRLRSAAANSISSIVGGPPRPSGLISEEPVWVAFLACDARDVDDTTPALLSHTGVDCPAQVEHPVHVDREGPLPLRICPIPERFVRA